MTSLKSLALFLICTAALALPTLAAAELAPPPQVLNGGFRPGWKTKTGGQMAALHLQLAPSWKTYWRAPGDAGIPPSFDWSGSENLASIRFHWPTPELFHSNGMRSVGYMNELILPFEAIPRDPSRPMRLQAQIDLGICKEICIPASFALKAELPATGQEDQLIRSALKSRPATGPEAGLKSITCAVQPIRDGLRLTAKIELPQQGAEEMVVFEPGLPGVWVSEAEVTRKGQALIATADMVPGSGQPFALNRSAVMVTVIGDHGRAVEIRGCPSS